MERREFIQSWTAKQLVQAYEALQQEIIENDSISQSDKILLQAMEKE
jgi:hypothetical protein